MEIKAKKEIKDYLLKKGKCYFCKKELDDRPNLACKKCQGNKNLINEKEKILKNLENEIKDLK